MSPTMKMLNWDAATVVVKVPVQYATTQAVEEIELPLAGFARLLLTSIAEANPLGIVNTLPLAVEMPDPGDVGLPIGEGAAPAALDIPDPSTKFRRVRAEAMTDPIFRAEVARERALATSSAAPEAEAARQARLNRVETILHAWGVDLSGGMAEDLREAIEAEADEVTAEYRELLLDFVAWLTDMDLYGGTDPESTIDEYLAEYAERQRDAETVASS